MASSPYLIQALQSMAEPVQVPQSAGLDLNAMRQAAQKGQAWRAANPGQSYIAHGLAQAGRNVMAAPGRIVSGLANLGGGLSSMKGLY